MRHEPFDDAGLARALGVSRLPRPVNVREFARSLPRHYPDELAGSGVRGAVLLSLDVDERGAVVSASAVAPPASGAVEVTAILVDAATGERREVSPARGAHPALRRAAEAAAHVLRFAPAERDGQPVAFRDYRLTVEVAPPGGST